MVVINKKYKVVRMNGIPVEVTVMGLDYSYPNKTLGRLTDTTGTQKHYKGLVLLSFNI